MKNLHLILILVAALYNLVPTGSPFRPLFDRASGGDATTHQDPPDGDPGTIVQMPPPR